MTLAQYLKKRQKTPWWSVVTSAPSKLMGWCLFMFGEKPKAEKLEAKTKSASLRPTRKEVGIAGAVASRISIEIDQKKMTITINVVMQDPQAAATVLDTIQSRLKAYMTECRTSSTQDTGI